jgi:ligand-binding sensor domain-containing protein
MKILWLLILFFYVLWQPAFAQEYGYTRYDNKNGLAGSTVYCMTQDNDGFIWFGTETGLSRFDGTHFKNFTKDDGLPDNEIIQLFADSKGRIWISPFKKRVCYYYKGKIYNHDNDPALAQLKLGDNIIRFAEDANGNILMHEFARLHLVKSTGQAFTIEKIGAEPLYNITGIARSASGKFWVSLKNRVFEFDNNRFTPWGTLNFKTIFFRNTAFSASGILAGKDDVRFMEYESFETNTTHTFTLSTKPHNMMLIKDKRFALCTLNGAFIYDADHPDSIEHFLRGIPVNVVMQDHEGNLWFGSPGQGVYRLNSIFVFNLSLHNGNAPTHQVLSFAPYKQWILAGTDMSILCRIHAETGKADTKNISLPKVGNYPVISITAFNDKEFIYGTDDGLYKLSSEFKYLKHLYPIVTKAFVFHKNNLLIATGYNAVIVDPVKFIVTDTIWHERATTIFVSDDKIYLGTLNGLYCRLPDKSWQYLGEKHPELRARITSIVKDHRGILWVGTYGDGMIAWKEGKIITHITTKNGLTSNVCRTSFLHENGLWVGTDKGLNKINLYEPGYPVKKYTTGDGLASDIINAIYIYKTKVFAGTPEGITFFDEQNMNSESRCDLRFTNITIEGQSYYPENMPRQLPHAKNNIRFDFVGISYKSAGDIRYRYRLLGVDSTWKETKETVLSYPTLPSGNYELQVQAINKFDVYSKILKAGFTIEELLWEKIWFRILMVMVFIAVTALVVVLIIQRIRHREQEKTSIAKRIGELEQLARKAQMNPHFIFNSLNSIQQYVMDADIAGANKFISGFSRLIRQTLDFSSKPEISLEEELDYLSNYLELETTRLENAFSWQITVAKDIKPADYYIPPMILQPFIENSVRHGVRFRRDKEGKVAIYVKKQKNSLICILEDNGVGRKAALRYKSISPIQYQSKGLSLTYERIAMLNMNSPHKITMLIDDLEDDQHNALGTRVTISFPIF